MLKNILAYFGYSPTSPFSFLLSEHKYCDNASTNSNSENARSRMLASLRGSVGTGTKQDEPSTGRLWAAGFHHVSVPSRLASFLKLMNLICFFNFPIFFRAAVMRECEDPPVFFLYFYFFNQGYLSINNCWRINSGTHTTVWETTRLHRVTPTKTQKFQSKFWCWITADNKCL